MPWNPEIYNKFKELRNKPFYDLIDFIELPESSNAIDLGCGTGEQTAILAAKFNKTDFLGIDSSAEMLLKSKSLETDNLHFKQIAVEDILDSDKKWDFVFSNAALQWSDNHEILFPKLIHLLNSKGQFAVQMPIQKENLLNKILYQLAEEDAFKTYFKGWRRDSPVLSMDQYAQIMFDGGLEEIQIMEKVYPIIANDHDTLYNFISGSALIPYLELLQDDQKESFISAFKNRIAENFPKLPAIYAFKRILLFGRRS
ncbi:trans-aconitate 2-methyltransferase [Flavobacterium aquidurense]|uniref:Trans-aconitate methyltransferase n=1 Tax=Flavobacterium frigidimaris TaxID=262320 RepID=A0ABX4BWI9_FLAFR|nr:methyltransferase domain-containing protein [Flavobacterium frigidimaris]OXA82073.1 trans-aconitate methyltransferase [Flavobacterium frigidimaris]SDY54185.1 trans-aconitate 2-methyltransferase [Flavobacterium aquidurense]